MKIESAMGVLYLCPETATEAESLEYAGIPVTSADSRMFDGKPYATVLLPTKPSSITVQLPDAASVPVSQLSVTVQQPEPVKWVPGARVRAALKARVVSRLVAEGHAREKVEEAFEEAIAVSDRPFLDWLANGGFEKLLEIVLNLLKLFSGV